MPPMRYPIPAETARVEIQMVNSRFIATIGEAQTVGAAKTFIAGIRAEFADATHHVYAYRIGYGGSITEGMSDDREPPGTAGRPALTVLRGAGIGDVVLVITRYFGGTKLGTGGLVRAYTQAAQQALSALSWTERVERRQGEMRIPYFLYERTKQLVMECQGEISREEFGADVTIGVSFSEDRVERFEGALREISAGKLSVAWTGRQASVVH